MPVLVIAGSADRLLPSTDEADRLKQLIPGSRSMVLQGNGHAPLFDGRVDMSEIITGDPALEGVTFPEDGGEVNIRIRLWGGRAIRYRGFWWAIAENARTPLPKL